MFRKCKLNFKKVLWFLPFSFFEFGSIDANKHFSGLVFGLIDSFDGSKIALKISLSKFLTTFEI